MYCLSVITNNLLVSGGGDGKLCMWNIPDGKLLKDYQFNEVVGLDKSIPFNSIYYYINKKLLFVTLLKYILFKLFILFNIVILLYICLV